MIFCHSVNSTLLFTLWRHLLISIRAIGYSFQISDCDNGSSNSISLKNFCGSRKVSRLLLCKDLFQPIFLTCLLYVIVKDKVDSCKKNQKGCQVKQIVKLTPVNYLEGALKHYKVGYTDHRR